MLGRVLRHPVWPTRDEEAARQAWSLYDQDESGVWTTTPLGVLNGLLRPVDLVVVVTTPMDDRLNIQRIHVMRWSRYRRETEAL
jgi:hypothetical protein